MSQIQHGYTRIIAGLIGMISIVIWICNIIIIVFLGKNTKCLPYGCEYLLFHGFSCAESIQIQIGICWIENVIFDYCFTFRIGAQANARPFLNNLRGKMHVGALAIASVLCLACVWVRFCMHKLRRFTIFYQAQHAHGICPFVLPRISSHSRLIHALQLFIRFMPLMNITWRTPFKRPTETEKSPSDFSNISTKRASIWWWLMILLLELRSGHSLEKPQSSTS